MADYRFYLLEAGGRICAGADLRAADDADANVIARLYYAACSDVFVGYELWDGSHLVACPDNADGLPATEAHHEALLQLDVRLRVFPVVARSRKLKTEIARLRWRSPDVTYIALVMATGP